MQELAVAGLMQKSTGSKLVLTDKCEVYLFMVQRTVY